MSLGVSSGDQGKDVRCLGTLRSWGTGTSDPGTSRSGWSSARPGDADFAFDVFASGKSLISAVFPLCKMGRIITSYLAGVT